MQKKILILMQLLCLANLLSGQVNKQAVNIDTELSEVIVAKEKNKLPSLNHFPVRLSTGIIVQQVNTEEASMKLYFKVQANANIYHISYRNATMNSPSYFMSIAQVKGQPLHAINAVIKAGDFNEGDVVEWRILSVDAEKNYSLQILESVVKRNHEISKEAAMQFPVTAAVTISPNPVHHQLTAELHSAKGGSSTYTITDDKGSVVQKGQFTCLPAGQAGLPGQCRQTITTATLRPGSYTLSVQLGGQRLVRRFVKL